MKKHIIIFILFLSTITYGQQQEFKAKGVKYEYDALEKIETYYTSLLSRPHIRGSIRMRTISTNQRTMLFILGAGTHPIFIHNFYDIDSIKIFNKDLESLECDNLIDRDSEYYNGWICNARFILNKTEIDLLKDILKYKKVSMRVYYKNQYIECLEKRKGYTPALKGTEALVNLVNIYYKLYDKYEIVE